MSKCLPNWTREEIDYLVRAMYRGEPWEVLEKALGRSKIGIQQKWIRLRNEYGMMIGYVMSEDELQSIVAAAQAGVRGKKAEKVKTDTEDVKTLPKLKRWAAMHPPTESELKGVCDELVNYMAQARFVPSYASITGSRELSNLVFAKFTRKIYEKREETDEDAVNEP